MFQLIKIIHSNGLKGQRAISPGQRPGYQISANIALKGQKNNGVNNSYAPSGRIVTSILTQGVALGCDLIALSLTLQKKKNMQIYA